MREELKLKIYKHVPFLLKNELEKMIRAHNDEMLYRKHQSETQIERLLSKVSSEKLIHILKQNYCNLRLDSVTPNSILHNKILVDYAVSCSKYNILQLPNDMITDEHIKLIEQDEELLEFAGSHFYFKDKYLSSRIIMNKIIENTDEFFWLLKLLSVAGDVQDYFDKIVNKISLANTSYHDWKIEHIPEKYRENYQLVEIFIDHNLEELDKCSNKILKKYIRNHLIDSIKNYGTDFLPSSLKKNSILLEEIMNENMLKDFVYFFDENAFSETIIDKLTKDKFLKEEFIPRQLYNKPSFLNYCLNEYKVTGVDSYGIENFTIESINDNNMKELIEFIKNKDGFYYLHNSIIYSNYFLKNLLKQDNIDWNYVKQFSAQAFDKDLIHILIKKYGINKAMELEFIKENLDNVYDNYIADEQDVKKVVDSIESLNYIDALFFYKKCKDGNTDFSRFNVNEIDIYHSILNLIVRVYGEENKSLVQSFVSNVMNNKRNPFTMYFTSYDDKLLFAASNFGDILTSREAEELGTIPLEILKNINKKQVGQIIEGLKKIQIDYKLRTSLAIKMYLSIGYNISMSLLNGNYGEIKGKFLITRMFQKTNVSATTFEKTANGNIPVLNYDLINLLFGSSYKVKNTPIRNLLLDYKEMQEEVTRRRQKILKDMSLSSTERELILEKIDKDFEKYRDDIVTFSSKFADIMWNYEAIVEEFYKIQNKSSRELKLNISTINEISNKIKSNRPELEVRDAPLEESDVFDYVGLDNQFTSNPETAPLRAIELSRKMDIISKKKFPNIELNLEGYRLFVYHPQDRRLLSAGYRSHCCFRPNGNADNSGQDNSLLTYCVSTEYGGGIEIQDENGETIMFSPILRNGNVLMIHSIETKGMTPSQSDIVHQLLSMYAKENIEDSYRSDDEIDFVTITDLHNLDKNYTSGELPINKKFSVLDEERNFQEMYTNLDTNHMVLASRDGKTFDDIKYGSVTKSYDYEKRKDYQYSIQIPSESHLLIDKMKEIEDKIIDISNERMQIPNYHEDKRYLLLVEINRLKIERLNIYKELLLKNKNNDIYMQSKKAYKVIESINEKNHKNEEFQIREMYYGKDWYIALDENGVWHMDALERGMAKLKENIEKIKKLYSDFSFNENNGGLKR